MRERSKVQDIVEDLHEVGERVVCDYCLQETCGLADHEERRCHPVYEPHHRAHEESHVLDEHRHSGYQERASYAEHHHHRQHNRDHHHTVPVDGLSCQQDEYDYYVECEHHGEEVRYHIGDDGYLPGELHLRYVIGIGDYRPAAEAG